MHLDPKALEAAVTASTNAMIRNEPDVEAAIRAYLSASLPADAAELVERLRAFAAGCRGSMWQSRDETIRLCDEAASLIQSQAARIAELEAGLEPFATNCDELFNDWCPDETPAWHVSDEDMTPSPVTVGNFRAARALLNRRAEG